MKQLNDLETYLVHEFVEVYQDGLLSRRDLMRRVLHIAGGVGATVLAEPGRGGRLFEAPR